MTDRIEAIRARWDAATPGPWSWRWGFKADHKHSDLVRIVDPRIHPHNVLKTTEDWPPTEADAEAIANAPEDIAYLLDAYRHMVDSWKTDADAIKAVEAVEALAANWERLAAAAMDEDVREWCTAAAKSVRDALAPVAPDAEPTEWVWSLNDTVQHDDHVWIRVSDTDGYPWRSVTGSDQRDQDITELVTKHGGRVLVCKARGIGGAPC